MGAEFVMFGLVTLFQGKTRRDPSLCILSSYQNSPFYEKVNLPQPFTCQKLSGMPRSLCDFVTSRYRSSKDRVQVCVKECSWFE